MGGGVQSRGVRCANPSGCSSHRVPVASQTCAIRKQCDSQWFTGKALILDILLYFTNNFSTHTVNKVFYGSVVIIISFN